MLGCFVLKRLGTCIIFMVEAWQGWELIVYPLWQVPTNIMLSTLLLSLLVTQTSSVRNVAFSTCLPTMAGKTITKCASGKHRRKQPRKHPKNPPKNQTTKATHQKPPNKHQTRSHLFNTKNPTLTNPKPPNLSSTHYFDGKL